MANYICQIITPRVSSRFIGKITVPQGGLIPGSVVIADTLDNSIPGNYEVFTATTPSTAKITSNSFAVVMNDGFETMADGRRPAGQPNYYGYTYNAGDVAPILFLEKHLTFNIGADCIAENTKNLAVVGNYLIPVNGSTVLNASATIPNGTGAALKILSTYNTPVGGLYGGGFALSYICVPVLKENVSARKYNLTINQGEGTTLTITRNGEAVQAGTGVLNAGDTLIISSDPEDSKLQINGEEWANPSTYIVDGNVTVVSTANGG